MRVVFIQGDVCGCGITRWNLGATRHCGGRLHSIHSRAINLHCSYSKWAFIWSSQFLILLDHRNTCEILWICSHPCASLCHLVPLYRVPMCALNLAIIWNDVRSLMLQIMPRIIWISLNTFHKWPGLIRKVKFRAGQQRELMHRLDPELRKLDAMIEALEPGRWDDVGCFKTETSDTLWKSVKHVGQYSDFVTIWSVCYLCRRSHQTLLISQLQRNLHPRKWVVLLKTLKRRSRLERTKWNVLQAALACSWHFLASFGCLGVSCQAFLHISPALAPG